MNKITIGIVTCNSMPQIIYTLNSILESVHFPNYEILINDSESVDGTKAYLDSLEKLYKHIKIMHSKKEGYIKAANALIKEVKDGDILLTHDDVIFPNLYKRCWLNEMFHMSLYSDAGLISCLNGGGTSSEDFVKDFNWIGTWCMYIPRKTIEKIGYFDEKFNIGFGDDIDYSYRIRKAKLNIYIAYFWVDHHRMTNHTGEQRTKEELDEIKRKNAEYFREKYKDDLI